MFSVKPRRLAPLRRLYASIYINLLHYRTLIAVSKYININIWFDYPTIHCSVERRTLCAEQNLACVCVSRKFQLNEAVMVRWQKAEMNNCFSRWFDLIHWQSRHFCSFYISETNGSFFFFSFTIARATKLFVPIRYINLLRIECGKYKWVCFRLPHLHWYI